MIDAGAKGRQFADMDRLPERDPIDRKGDGGAPGKSRGAGKGHPVEQIEEGAAIRVAGKFAMSGVISTVISSLRGSVMFALGAADDGLTLAGKPGRGIPARRAKIMATFRRA